MDLSRSITQQEIFSEPPPSAESERTFPHQVVHRIICNIKGMQNTGHLHGSRQGCVISGNSAETWANSISSFQNSLIISVQPTSQAGLEDHIKPLAKHKVPQTQSRSHSCHIMLACAQAQRVLALTRLHSTERYLAHFDTWLNSLLFQVNKRIDRDHVF